MSEYVHPEDWVDVKDDVYLVSGQSNPDLAARTAEYMGIPLYEAELKKFANTERYARLADTVRGKHVVVMQSHCETPALPLDSAIAQQRFIIMAARDAGATSITAVATPLGYQRQDRKAKPREAIAGAQIIKDIQAVGASSMLVMDLHAGQLQGHFEGPMTHISAFPILVKRMVELMGDEDRDHFIMLGADAGRVATVENFAGPLGVDIGFVNKIRDENGVITSMKVIGEVAGRTAFILDDIIDTAGTIAGGASLVKEDRAKRVSLFATYGFFSGKAAETLAEAPIEHIYVTDAIPQDANTGRIRGLEVLPVSQQLGNALIAHITNNSVSAATDKSRIF